MNVGAMRDVVTIQTPGAPVPDGALGFTQAWTTVVERMPANVQPATSRDLERVVANTVEAAASHLVTIRYVAGITTKARVVLHDLTDRTFAVVGVFDPDERHRELQLACEEVVS